MVVLDTNHLRCFEEGDANAETLRNRLVSSGQEVTTAVVAVQEAVNGWLVEVNRHAKEPHRQIHAYAEFYRQVETYARWTVLPWADEEADLFVKHRAAGVRIGSMDLKIACIALTHDALLLTRNTVDFSQVPGLKFENWID